VEFVAPNGYVFSPQDQGADDTVDSDADADGQTVCTTLESGENDTSWDAGLYEQASIGDTVWEDVDGDGIQDVDEPGLEGVIVNLYDCDGNLIASTTTDADGLYNFTVPPGDYYVEFVAPNGYVFTPQDQGADDTVDSDANVDGQTVCTTLDQGEDDTTWDAGLYRPASIGDRVWEDVDGDGVQDAGEPGIPGVTVELYECDGTTPIASTTTDANGDYLFSGLVPGCYEVEFTAPAGSFFSPQDQGADDAIDSDADPTSGRTDPISLESGETDLTWDAGLYEPATLGDRVWEDSDSDGIQDTGEPGIPGVTVELYECDGTTPIATDTTDASGFYLFDGLAPGCYVVDFSPANGYVFSPQDQGTNDALDSDANPTNGRTGPISLESGETDLTWDAGLYQTTAIGDLVWEDLDADGVQDAGEPGIPGVTVELYDCQGNLVETAVTGANGEYLFDNLMPGCYEVEFTAPAGYTFSPQDQGADDAADSDADPTSGRTVQTTLESGETDLTWDAGLYQTAALGDRVWEDVDGDGIQDAGEPGIPGVTVELYDCDGNLIATDVTDASGLYLFEDVEPGCYVVEFVAPAGYTFSPQDQGTDDAADSDANPANGRTTQITLDSGETDLTWDAGLYEPATIGDRVWEDTDGDGIQDAGEPGLANVTVNLYDCATDELVATTTTNGLGFYSFTVAPGEYYVEFVAPTGYSFSPQDEGTSDAVDSDANADGQTVCTTLESGETDLTWDGGLYRTAALGDYVWQDADADGIQDAGEPGVAGVTVHLYACGGTMPVATTATDASGFYLFDDLAPGCYVVRFMPPLGYAFSPQDQGTNDAVDSDANPANGRTIQITLDSGETDLTWDAGLYRPATLGDRVWRDLDADGIQDAGEPGIPAVIVELYACGGTTPVAVTITDAGGNYLFSGLVPGCYEVEFTAPAGYTFSPQDQGTDNAFDSDADPTTGRTDPITLSSGEIDLTWDAGLYEPAALGDYVWLDGDSDGIQDAGEPGIPGVTVELYECDGTTPSASTTTDADGLYLFDDLAPGCYEVRFVAPAGHVFGPQDQGTNDAVDSDADPTTGRTDPITLDSGETDLTWDAGLYQPTALGDRVWEDLDADGIQDAGEPGIAGVTVNLYDCDGNLVATDTTDASGFYLFDGLEPGCYVVEFVAPTGSSFSPQDQGTDDAVDSDADPTTGRTDPITVESGETDLTWDAGLYEPAALGDYVWEDLDADGIQDAGEPGIPAVTVYLYECGGMMPVAIDVTDASGFYLFDDLAPGCYMVYFVAPTGYTFSPQDQGTDDAADSDADPTIGLTDPISLDSGETDLTWDAGLYQPASIGDRVWEDLDVDGFQDAGEPGIPGVTVELYDCDGNLIATDVTDASGNYLFTGLVPGCYEVEFTAPTGASFSPQDQGTNDAVDSDADPTTGRTDPIIVESGETDLTWDAGVYEAAALGDYVWLDSDADGIQDAGEPGIVGVTVELYECDGTTPIATDTTNASGYYLFPGLEPGCYEVEFTAPAGYIFSPQDQGTNDAVDSDADPTTGRTTQITLDSGETDLTWDAGLYQTTALGDYVWEDLDADGIQDAGEPGFAGVTVELYDCDGNLVATDTTDANGFYLFDDLVPGCYEVEFVAPSGYVYSPQDQGTDDAVDSDADPTTGRTDPITLDSGETDLTWDAGLYRPASIGDRVWEDTDGDGIQDAGEPGIPGVTVELYDCDGNLVATDVTDASGLYLFDGLEPGCYEVEFNAPAGASFSPQDQGADDTADSDADPTSGRTDPITVESGETDLTWDAGLSMPATIGDRVWQDLDGDGIQDAGEPGIPGVTVELYNCATGGLVATTTTNANGFYSFTVAPGEYYIQFVAPNGYVYSPQDQGTDDAFDSDANASGQTVCTTLGSGEVDTTWDAGMYQPAAVGDRVWQDLDSDGIQDAGEPGYVGATVNLYDCEGNTVASDSTDASGNYLFTGLVPGCYVVEFVPPAGYGFSPQDQGADDAADSDADPASGRTVQITLDAGETDLTWDAGLLEAMCSLTVTKTCQVPPPPTTFDCSDAKPIDELTMIWDGVQNIRIRAWSDNVGSSTLLADIDNITPGQEVTVSGFAGSPNDVYWEIFQAGTLTKIGESTFHRSCSDDDMNGPEDCGKLEGDGKDKSGYINEWLFEGMAGNGQQLICTPTPPEPSDTCELQLTPPPSCETMGDPTSLTFQYSGGGCAASDNTQDKDTCSGSIDDSLPVMVTAHRDSYVITPSTVNPGEEFTVTASGFDADSYFYLTNAGGTEENKIHTSCSQPLAVGDVFGSLTLVAFDGQRAGDEVTYNYQVTNNGTDLSGVTLVDVPLGDIAGPFDLAAGESRVFQTVARILETITNIGTFSGSMSNGAVCSASDTATVTVIQPCFECDGGVVELTLRYLGEAAALIQVYEGQDDRADHLLFAGTVQPGDTFTFTGIRSDSTMSSEIGVYVDGVQNTVIHTSCSRPIGPGLVSGDFEVVEGYSRDNGLLCPLFGPGFALCQLGDPRVLTMNYTGETCVATSHSQDPSRVECIDYGTLPASVYIRASNRSDPYDGGARVWFQGPVDLDSTFDIDATLAGENKLNSDTYVHIFNQAGGTLLQYIRFHTSCSQPLYEGDQFGSLVLVGYVPE
jgi:protocatechuate 3,4-dioxygenase beta subunit